MPVAWATGVEKTLKRQAFGTKPSLTPEYMAYSNAQRILSITGTFFTAALIIVLLRCYVRAVMLRVFGKDDYMMVVAMLFATITFVCFVIETHNGLGGHLMVLLMNPVMYKKFAKVLYIHSLMVMVGLSCVKISIAYSLLRLSASKKQTRFLQGVIIFIVAITIACAGTLIFQCLPVEAAWDSSLRPEPLGTGNARCFSSTTFRDIGLMNSVFNIVTDILFATLPIPLVWKLKINIRTKISLIVILSLGWFACGAAIVKAAQQYTVLDDPDWSVNDSFNVWNYIELTIGILAASLPALKPLFNWALDTARGYSSNGRTNGKFRPSAYAAAHSLGYHNMASQENRSIPMRSLRGEGERTNRSRDPYSVQVSTNHPEHSGKADKDAWDIVNAKDSTESINSLGPGPKDIMMTTEVRIS